MSCEIRAYQICFAPKFNSAIVGKHEKLAADETEANRICVNLWLKKLDRIESSVEYNGIELNNSI